MNFKSVVLAHHIRVRLFTTANKMVDYFTKKKKINMVDSAPLIKTHMDGFICLFNVVNIIFYIFSIESKFKIFFSDKNYKIRYMVVKKKKSVKTTIFL